MRFQDVKQASRTSDKPFAGEATSQQWIGPDYFLVVATTAALIAPAPFFWGPPV